MAAAKLPQPVFDVNGFFRAVFSRSAGFAMKGEKLGERLGEKLGENERRILQLIEADNSISISIMAKTVGISTTAVDNNLKKLKQKGVLRRIGPDRGGHWKILA